jgi:hypothetical protein
MANNGSESAREDRESSVERFPTRTTRGAGRISSPRRIVGTIFVVLALGSAATGIAFAGNGAGSNGNGNGGGHPAGCVEGKGKASLHNPNCP